ncbi:MAG: carboxylating nicotinate-nucleotide diphosphorylase [Deltaproteobacteria bacterium]|nr:carboxylating nicotinate-nucleotide diphosphorylase [Deltaproteobacteria bacterium]
MNCLPSKHAIHKIIRIALEEDIGAGDVTTASVLQGGEKGRAVAVAKSEMVVAGIEVFKETFLFLDGGLKFKGLATDGALVKKGVVLAEISGSLGSILTAERTALNLFQRMSGIATLARRFSDEVKGTKAKILDTRKTAPGLRVLDKYAVKVGGAYNHRFGLDDGILIKDNHIEAAGGITAALEQVRRNLSYMLKVEIEAKNLKEVKEALAAGADIIMLDNMSVADMKECMKFVKGRAPLEASGNVSLAGVRAVAETGIDFISVGALTHSVTAADISLKIKHGF